MYAAKNALRGESVADPPMAGQGAKRSEISFIKKTIGFFDKEAVRRKGQSPFPAHGL